MSSFRNWRISQRSPLSEAPVQHVILRVLHTGITLASNMRGVEVHLLDSRGEWSMPSTLSTHVEGPAIVTFVERILQS